LLLKENKRKFGTGKEILPDQRREKLAEKEMERVN
jgi:hypothetical protein